MVDAVSNEDMKANTQQLREALEDWKSANGIPDVSPKGGKLEDLLEKLTSAVVALSEQASN